MSSRVVIWLTDEEMADLKARAEASGIAPWEQATLVMGKYLGAELPPSKKGRRNWLERHETQTRKEYATSGSSTVARVVDMLKASDRALSTSEIKLKLGWKQSGSLNETLKESPVFRMVKEPDGIERKRGRQPHWWVLSAEYKG